MASCHTHAPLHAPLTHPSHTSHTPPTHFFPTPSAYFTIRIGRRRHPYRSTQTSASVDADIRIGRRRHPHRSVQTSVSVGADCLYFAAHSKSVCTIRSAERPSQRSGMPQCFHLPSTMRAISSPSSTGSSPTSTLEPTFTVSMCSV